MPNQFNGVIEIKLICCFKVSYWACRADKLLAKGVMFSSINFEILGFSKVLSLVFTFSMAEELLRLISFIDDLRVFTELLSEFIIGEKSDESEMLESLTSISAKWSTIEAIVSSFLFKMFFNIW